MTSAPSKRKSTKVEEFAEELPSGTTLLHGQYRIEGFLNSGGFGLTYLAKDSLDRTVVIKECFPATLCRRQDGMVVARSRGQQDEFRAIVRLFVHEARRLAKLDHPNIVGVHQVFEDNETAYMALDYVHGQDLHDVVEREPGRLTPQRVIDILKKILEAVAFIHDRQVLHRDISPDNILLDAKDNPVLIDFGAAREKATRASRTLSSLLVVKDGYSPQEFYIEGGKQGPASDIYALGATFYHILTGAPPPNSHARLAAVAAEEPDPYVPLIGRSDLFTPEFLGAIDQALALFPKDRTQSALEWLIEIDVEKRREAAMLRARDDANMERSISRLVEETNRAVLEARRIEEKRAQEDADKPTAREQQQKKPFFAWQLEEGLFTEDDPLTREDQTAGRDEAAVAPCNVDYGDSDFDLEENPDEEATDAEDVVDASATADGRRRSSRALSAPIRAVSERLARRAAEREEIKNDGDYIEAGVNAPDSRPDSPASYPSPELAAQPDGLETKSRRPSILRAIRARSGWGLFGSKRERSTHVGKAEL